MTNCKNCKQCGGRVAMPLEYYGGKTGAYVSKLENLPNNSFGTTVAQSFGVSIPGINAVGPNMYIHPNSNGFKGGAKKTKKSKGKKSKGKKSKGKKTKGKKTKGKK